MCVCVCVVCCVCVCACVCACVCVCVRETRKIELTAWGKKVHIPLDGIRTCTPGKRAHHASDHTTRAGTPRGSRNKTLQTLIRQLHRENTIMQRNTPTPISRTGRGICKDLRWVGWSACVRVCVCVCVHLLSTLFCGSPCCGPSPWWPQHHVLAWCFLTGLKSVGHPHPAGQKVCVHLLTDPALNWPLQVETAGLSAVNHFLEVHKHKDERVQVVFDPYIYVNFSQDTSQTRSHAPHICVNTSKTRNFLQYLEFVKMKRHVKTKSLHSRQKVVFSILRRWKFFRDAGKSPQLSFFVFLQKNLTSSTTGRRIQLINWDIACSSFSMDA